MKQKKVIKSKPKEKDKPMSASYKMWLRYLKKQKNKDNER